MSSPIPDQPSSVAPVRNARRAGGPVPTCSASSHRRDRNRPDVPPGRRVIFDLKGRTFVPIISVVVGGIVMGGAFIGRNIDHYINLIRRDRLPRLRHIDCCSCCRPTRNFLNSRICPCIARSSSGRDADRRVFGFVAASVMPSAEAYEADSRTTYDPDKPTGSTVARRRGPARGITRKGSGSHSTRP